MPDGTILFMSFTDKGLPKIESPLIILRRAIVCPEASFKYRLYANLA